MQYRQHVPRALLILCCVVYLASMALPVVPREKSSEGQFLHTVDPSKGAPKQLDGWYAGYEVFLETGQAALLAVVGVVQFLPCWVWFANPIAWFGFARLVLRRGKSAAILAGVAAFLGLLAGLVFSDVRRPGFPLSIGYYAWFASLVLLTVAASWEWWLQTRGTTEGEHSGTQPPEPQGTKLP